MYQKNRCHANFFSLKIAVWIFLFSLILPVTAAEEEGLSYEVIIDPQYEDADSFSQGLAAVKKDGKWGYIDMEGNTVIPFQFDYAPSLVFDRTGKQVLQILQDMSREKGATVIIVTHNAAIAPIADRVIHMHDATVKAIEQNALPKKIADIEW